MQRQIYNLMKFDSYPRFLKSHVYKECIRLVMGKDWYGGVWPNLWSISPTTPCYAQGWGGRRWRGWVECLLLLNGGETQGGGGSRPEEVADHQNLPWNFFFIFPYIFHWFFSWFEISNWPTDISYQFFKKLPHIPHHVQNVEDFRFLREDAVQHAVLVFSG